MGAAAKQADTSKVENVVVPLGTNDITWRDGTEVMLNASSALSHVRERSPDAHIALCSIPPRKGHERDQTSANDATIGENSYLLALSRRSNNVQYIDTFSTLAPKGVVQNQLFSNTYPA